MAVDHIALEIIQIDIVEKGAVVDEQDVPVIAACFVEGVQRRRPHRSVRQRRLVCAADL